LVLEKEVNSTFMVGRVRAINKFLFGKEAKANSRASISMCSLPPNDTVLVLLK
jgi:hypothetical protein